MSKFKYLILLCLGFTLSCTDDLEVVNPNAPTLEVLETEEGLVRFAASTYLSGFGTSFDANNSNFIWQVQAIHESMGDNICTPWGNFGYRWVNQPTSVTLDDGTVVPPPQGLPQPEQLTSLNSRSVGELNAFRYEWAAMYRLNNIQNNLLAFLDGHSADQGIKDALTAWAYFWKGMAYSRIGLMYSAGLIIDDPNPNVPLVTSVDGNFVDNTAMLAEAETNWGLAESAFNAITDAAALQDVLSRVIPDFMYDDPADLPDAAGFIRIINTLRARTLMSSQKTADMGRTEWEAILALANAGMEMSDVPLYIRGATANDPITDEGLYPHGMAAGLWHFISMRHWQDYNDGDQRRDRNFSFDPDDVFFWPNPRGRGIHYGTDVEIVSINNGGDYFEVSEIGMANIILFGSWEENALIRAEALINTGDPEGGLALIDAVREFQTAGLMPMAGTNLSQAEAQEELRKERRTGLFLRGLAFYDARRWGITAPVAQGGGRSGAWVYDSEGNLNTNATIDYNYLDFFGVPANELDFNSPEPGSASVAPR
ncbi:MAG: RagB/SusD family nutrient uptake outer membrane protein [Bacteroidota bacterium]